VKPEIIDQNTTLILELKCPFTTVLVLGVFSPAAVREGESATVRGSIIVAGGSPGN